MKKIILNIGVLFIALILIGAVYKWVDESGKVHYGDSPPEEIDAQSVAVPEGPSQEEVEQAQQRLHEKVEKYEKLSEPARQLETLDQPPDEAKSRVLIPDNVACFTPLSDLVEGLSGKTFTPITPNSLTNAQQRLIINLFRKLEGRWQGTITDVSCKGKPLEPISKIKSIQARTKLDWDKLDSQLIIESETTDTESRTHEIITQMLEVGDALYFRDYGGSGAPQEPRSGTIALEGNMVEVLTINQNLVSFLTKKRISGQPYGEVRHLELSGGTIKFVELYFFESLTGSKTWVLSR
ncbi:MAG: DUF4124 domain-containing protein [Gammaproteobacteria bacterium]|nr:DUF4124 domain-containing protein [Gammaproteobacteria bacterium]